MILFIDNQYYSCCQCTKSYKYFSNLCRHLKLECGKEPKFFCPIAGCGYKSKQKTSVICHAIMKHKMVQSSK
ncbi:hypothetical protein PGB90_007303 [Kerria lacca]